MMRRSDCIQLAEILLPHLPDFASSKRGDLFIAPIGNLLRGFAFESTAYNRQEFYFWWFFTPICGPIDHIAFNNGGRLNVPHGHSGWRTDMEHLPAKLLEAIQPELPILRSMKSNQNAIDALYQIRAQETAGPGSKREVTDIYTQHDIACLFILDGQFDKAKCMLNRIIKHEHGKDRRQWLLDVVDRIKDLQKILAEDPQLAVAQVKKWQDMTFKALGLDKWR